MTILFAFFVLLFAYQKTTISLAGRVQKSQGTQADVQLQAKTAAQVPGTSELTAQPATLEATQVAVSAMKSQALAQAVSRDLGSESRPSKDSVSAVTTAASPPTTGMDPFVGAARLAWAQSGQSISVALRKATEGKQVEVVSLGREVRLEVSEAILFDPASADLSRSGSGLLDEVVPILREQTGIVFVEGHTDNTPIANSRFPSNWELSTARATEVTRYLISQGIASERLRAVGLADTHPRADNETYEGRARNRRVSLVLDTEPSNS
jgi:chemotaxis protein MotB